MASNIYITFLSWVNSVCKEAHEALTYKQKFQHLILNEILLCYSVIWRHMPLNLQLAKGQMHMNAYHLRYHIV